MNGCDEVASEGRGRSLLFFVNVGWFFLSHRLPLAVAARNAGYQVHVACGVEGPREGDEIRNQGFGFHQLPATRGSGNPLNDVAMAVALLQVVRNLRPHILHCVTAKQVIVGGLIGRILGVPATIGALTGLGYLYTGTDRRRILRKLVSKLLRVATDGPRSRLILQNRHDQTLLELLGAVAPGKSVIVEGSGVDLELYQPVPEPTGKPIVILPARMLRDKGVVEFCHAAGILRQRGCNATFALVGSEDLFNPSAIDSVELERLCRDAGVERWGHCADMPGAYARSTIVCLPSYREGLPKALIEAAAMGRAIVTTDVPGCRDVVEDGVTGLLVPARNHVALSEALERLISDAALRHKLTAAALLQARDRFDQRRIIRETLTIYREALAGERR